MGKPSFQAQKEHEPEKQPAPHFDLIDCWRGVRVRATEEFVEFLAVDSGERRQIGFGGIVVDGDRQRQAVGQLQAIESRGPWRIENPWPGGDDVGLDSVPTGTRPGVFRGGERCRDGQRGVAPRRVEQVGRQADRHPSRRIEAGRDIREAEEKFMHEHRKLPCSRQRCFPGIVKRNRAHEDSATAHPLFDEPWIAVWKRRTDLNR